MTAGYIDLFMDQGVNFSHTINITDDNTNAPINLVGYEIYCTLKRSYYSANTSANAVCTVVNASNGEFSITMNRAITANLEPGRYVFDVITKNGEIVDKILEGVMHVNPTVTILG